MNIIINIDNAKSILSMPSGAIPSNKNNGNPKAIAYRDKKIKFEAAGVSYLGSISLSKIKPVEFVPVNIPNKEINASSL